MPAEIPDGAVIIARAIINSSLWTMRNEDRILALLCIVKANWKPRRWYDGKTSVTVKRGQFISSRRHLAEEANLTVQQTRTSLKRLEKCGFLTRQSTHAYTLITLPKYDVYQDLSKYSDRTNPEVNTSLTHTQPKPHPRVTQTQPKPNHKQEGEEREERKEGEEREEGAPRAGEVTLQDALNATAYFGSPGAKAREAALKDLYRQKIPYERISSIAGESESKQMDFYEFVKKCRNGTNGASSGADEWLRKQKGADDE